MRESNRTYVLRTGIRGTQPRKGLAFNDASLHTQLDTFLEGAVAPMPIAELLLEHGPVARLFHTDTIQEHEMGRVRAAIHSGQLHARNSCTERLTSTTGYHRLQLLEVAGDNLERTMGCS